MKKLFLIMLLVVGGVSHASAKTILLKPNSWTDDGWCALWVWKAGSQGSWKNLADITLTDSVYQVTVDDGITNWKLVMGSGDTPSWDNDKKSAESADLVYEALEDHFYDFNRTGNVSVGDGITKKVLFRSCSIIGPLLNSFDLGTEVEMTRDPDDPNIYTLVTEKSVLAKTYEYKLIANHKWSVYELPDKGNNNFTFNEAGDYQLTFTANVSKHELSLTAKKIVNLAASGKTTFSSEDPYNFSGIDGLQAYLVSEITPSYARLTAIDDVPSSTGVILIGAASGKYTIPFGSATSILGKNMLKAAVNATEVADNKAYVLYNGEFHPANAGTIPAGKAYLDADDVPAGAHSLSLLFGDEPTEIEGVKDAKVNNAQFYNLAGQRIATPERGIYIVNGKKIIINK